MDKDEEGTSIETTTKNGEVCKLKGTWIDIHDKPMSFNTRRFHKIEPHEGHMWTLHTRLVLNAAPMFVQSWRNLSFHVLNFVQNKIDNPRAEHEANFLTCSQSEVCSRS